MNAWRHYWQWHGFWYGSFQAFMVTIWVASGIGMVGGIAWMWWEALT